MRKARWASSLLGKITVFLVAGVLVAYFVGTSIGWLTMERSHREQWRRQAEFNAQVASAAIRGIYTSVAVETSGPGQVQRIVSARAIGDDQSVLDTGFVPTDVMALASSQTKRKVWLLRWDDRRFITITDGDGGDVGLPLAFADDSPRNRLVLTSLRVGVMRIGAEEHFASYLPIVSPVGEVLGAVVASAGLTSELAAARWQMFANAAVLLVVVVMMTGGVTALLTRRLFRPVPVLIAALSRLARNQTDAYTPYQDRDDEIGRLAVAIETLRAAVVEREALRTMRETARQMEHLAHHDPLTGLPNRALFQKTLQTALDGLAAGGPPINLMIVDLDRFKPVNDTFGHAVGDGVLTLACERLAALLGAEDLIARLGGDEFAVIQRPGVDTVRGAERLAARVVEAAALPIRLEDGREVAIGASVGVACAPAHGSVAAELIRNADLALYAAKDAGRGCFRLFSSGMTMPGPAPLPEGALDG